MEGGRNLARPPVSPSLAAFTSSLLRGSSFVADGAGGFGAVLAVPTFRLVQRGPAEPSSTRTIAASTLYGPKRALGKQRISR